MRLSPAALAVALACATCPLAASAADKDEAAPPAPASSAPAAPPVPETADSLYNQGNDAYDRGDYSLAFELYTGAFKLRKSYDIARNIGLTELKLGRFKDAIGHLSYSLDLYPSNRPDTKKQVVAWLAEARAQVGKLSLRVSPESAECRVAGAAAGPDAREEDLLVDPGEVKIECRAAGRRTEKRTITIEKGGRAELALALAPDATGPGPGPGDGSPRTVLVWAGSAAAATGLGVGAAVGVVSLVKASEADGMLARLRDETNRSSPCAAPKAAGCDELYALRREQDAFGNTAFWMLIAGGVAGAGTLAYGLVTAPAKGSAPAAPAPKAAVVPLVGPGTAGVVLSGAF